MKILYGWWSKRFLTEELPYKLNPFRVKRHFLMAFFLLVLITPNYAFAMQKQYDLMSDAVLLAMRNALKQSYTPRPVFQSVQHKIHWLSEMSKRLSNRIKSPKDRHYLIRLIRYEAQRAGLDPQLVFAVIDTESSFRKAAVSHVGAIGLMQIMPFWTRVLADGDPDLLYRPAINVRFGCLILSHYVDIEKGNVERALQRYNGSLGRTVYSDKVLGKLSKYWQYNW